MPEKQSPPVLPFGIARLGYVERFTPDIDRARAFHVDTFGLQISAEDERHLYLRALHERGHHSLIFAQGPEAGAGALGFRVAREEDLERAHRWFTGRGLRAEWIERPWTARRVLRAADPWGVPLEFYCGMTPMPPLHQRYRLHHGARPLWLDRVCLRTPDVAAAVTFYGALGFLMSEAVREKDSGRLRVALLGNFGTGETLSLVEGAGAGLHHLSWRVETPAHVLDFLDLMATTGHGEMIEHGPGRHGISNALYLYLLDADGHRTGLVCAGARPPGPDAPPIVWDYDDPRWQSLWGTPPPPGWSERVMPFIAPAPSARRAGLGSQGRAPVRRV
ncbi:catechol 2,3-dioxygenase [Meinhardsimonia xiamenensis]|jgi:catechol 2,3-dioxygenase|uniref:Catechol 2,3-dioxygenase n=1 Tax=Meinhardsimonia xiamenensis TaxID=990712 RepID=A0A1G8ZI31_9RHOB|nr:VOC family protein [Meinhardsimonia xiamenensis]PRX37723.1 catechol 2,3-dioxygenase [Meinhardsimonia xiamenensis]SDK14673.1 catechol 2,3-dioxygenase [Meinhardsimonia xiamenensis]